jgi:hypothetical protein
MTHNIEAGNGQMQVSIQRQDLVDLSKTPGGILNLYSRLTAHDIAIADFGATLAILSEQVAYLQRTAPDRMPQTHNTDDIDVDDVISCRLM